MFSCALIISVISLSIICLVKIWDVYRNLIHEFNVFSFYRTLFSVLLGFNKLKLLLICESEFWKNCHLFFLIELFLNPKVTVFCPLDELDNMNSTERISFLQEKLQEIRKYYMSLKSEVATIDREEKKIKKERQRR